MMMMMTYTSDWAVTSTLLFFDWSFSSRWGSFASSLNRWEWEWWQGLCCDNDDDDGDDDCHDDGGEGLEMMVSSSSSRGCGKAEGWDCSATGVQEREREWESGMGGWELWWWWWWYYHHMLNIDDGIADRHYDDAHDHGRPRESGWWASWKAARLPIKTINVIIITVANIISGLYDKIPFNDGICS